MNFSWETLSQALPGTPSVHMMTCTGTRVRVQCPLCEVELVASNESISSHCDEFKHRENIQRLLNDHNRIQSIAERHHRVCSNPTVARGLDHVTHREWRNEIEASLYRYVTSTQDTHHTLLEEPLVLIQKYESWERLVLLDLAVWKAECLAQVPLLAGVDFLTLHQWFSSGWKSCKAQQRKSNAMAIVVAAVLPFLATFEQEPELSDEKEHQ